jgi:hypothetical protein
MVMMVHIVLTYTDLDRMWSAADPTTKTAHTLKLPHGVHPYSSAKEPCSLFSRLFRVHKSLASYWNFGWYIGRKVDG